MIYYLKYILIIEWFILENTSYRNFFALKYIHSKDCICFGISELDIFVDPWVSHHTLWNNYEVDLHNSEKSQIFP